MVGTTSDYIDWLRRGSPNQLVFLTDCQIRSEAKEKAPSLEEEVCSNLGDMESATRAILNFVKRRNLAINGIACFDCESMNLSSRIAEAFGVPYPSPDSIVNCRDKCRSKKLWAEAGLRTPGGEEVKTPLDAARAFHQIGSSSVLKPTRGAGSELVFLAKTADEASHCFREIEKGLAKRRTNPLYTNSIGAKSAIVIEEIIEAQEYSCDFVFENNRVHILRIARKIPQPKGPFGTTMAYVLPESLPPEVSLTRFEDTLRRSAKALGIRRAISMLDFFVTNGEIVLLEMAPRPGGDCLPALIRHVYDVDILRTAVQYAAGKAIETAFPALSAPRTPLVGMRVHAPSEGTLQEVDVSSIRNDRRIREIHFIHQKGHVIKMPPFDYDSWLMGYVIFAPNKELSILEQCEEIQNRIRIEVKK